MNKKFLIIGFSPGLGIFLSALVKSLKNRGHKAILVGELISARLCFKNLDKEEINKIIAYENKFYNPNNIPGLKQQLINYTKRCACNLSRIINSTNFTDMIVWNGAPIFAQVAICLAKRKKIKIWYMENGSLPNTLQLDSKGINYDNSLSEKSSDFYLKQNYKFENYCSSITPLPHPPKFHHPFEMLFRYLNKFGIWFFIYIFWKNFLPDQYGKYLRKKVGEDKVDLPKKFIFIPLQVQDDTQIIINSPHIDNMNEFVELCYKTIKKVDPNIRVVVKEHPQDFGRRSYKKLSKKHKDIIWLKKYPINEVLKKSSVVITINSTVGIEALAYNKPVITLGKAFYNVDGLVHHAVQPEQLPELVNLALKNKPNLTLIDKFLGYLQKKYFIKGSWRKFSQETLNEITKKLLG